MRSDLLLDSNSWDLVITDDIGIVENAAMTSQDSKFSLQLIHGEVFDDNRIGMPWLTDMVSPQVSIAAKKQIIRDVIMSTPGAIELTRVEVAVDTDSAIATCEFEGITDNGEIFGTSITNIPTPDPEPPSIIAEYDYTTGRSFGLRLERASDGTYIDGGVLKTAGVNIPRFEANGLLIEPASTNIIRFSSDFGKSAWSGNRRVSFSTGQPSPDGGAVASLASPTTDNDNHQLGQALTLPDYTPHTMSIFAKPNDYKIVRIRLTDSIGLLSDAIIDTSTGAKLSGSGECDVLFMSNDWLRLTLHFTPRASATTSVVYGLWIYDNSMNPVFPGDGTSGVYVFGAQCERGISGTSYMPTTTASASRMADNLTLIQTGAKWLYREYIPLGSSAVTKELVAYTGEVCPYGHLQKLRVWNRDLTSNEREVLGV